ncbi:MAG TPA: hypothetical protein VJH22_01980 [Candidatus Nanoarchaeia archaeon]|nr:hypothetical protein [Candidatus Nanoarchaeia archaeon]
MKEPKLYAENSKVELYVYSGEGHPDGWLSKTYDELTRIDEKPCILFGELVNGRSLNEVLDYLSVKRNPWEKLVDDYPEVKINRNEVGEIMCYRNPRDKLLVLFSHTQPFYGFNGREWFSIEKPLDWVNLPGGGHAPYWVKDAKIRISRPLVEYAALEEFCEYVIGPSIRRLFSGTDSGVLEAGSELEAEVVMESLRGQDRDSNGWIGGGRSAGWAQLDILFPDFKQRVDRIKEFIADWFPGEIIKGRKSFDDARAWLQSLKD